VEAEVAGLAKLIAEALLVDAKSAGRKLRAYHSSPHDIEKFDMRKVGTGQGAQSYGHGMYFAESPAVSGQGGAYWNEFLNKFKGPEHSAAVAMKYSNFDREKAAALKRKIMMQNAAFAATQSPEEQVWAKALQEQDQATLDMLQSDKPVLGPRTYEVDIEAHPDELMDWDAPLREQSPVVQERFRKMPGSKGRLDLADPDMDMGQLYRRGMIPGGYSPKGTSEALDRAGIPGIKFLDQGSRLSDDAASQTRNYVIFNDKLITIVKKYGIAALLGNGLISHEMAKALKLNGIDKES
jgi:hypothetical protein